MDTTNSVSHQVNKISKYLPSPVVSEIVDLYLPFNFNYTSFIGNAMWLPGTV